MTRLTLWIALLACPWAGRAQTPIRIRNQNLFRGELGETILLAPPKGSLGAKNLLIIGWAIRRRSRRSECN